MKDLCIYHKNCSDGLAAALAVHERYGDIEFIPAQYGDAPIVVDGRNVIIVDFSYKRSVLLEMKNKAESLVVIDHHKTAKDELADLDFCIFNMEKCGAVLTWEHLFPAKPIPKLFEYVQDRDLWTWELPHSKEVSAALRSLKPWISEWRPFLNDELIEELVTDGFAILRYQKRCEEIALASPAQTVRIAGHEVPCRNSTHLISEICGEMAKGYPFAAVYFDTTDGKRVFSLRSREPRGIDVSAIAKQYGGGGHPAAAGFSVDIGLIEVVTA